MAKRAYVIVGASGQIGQVVAGCLVKRGHDVKAIGRDAVKLEALKAKGVKIMLTESFENRPLFEKAFQGADAAFFMIPPGYNTEDLWAFQDRVGQTLTDAAAQSGLSAIVNLSSLGADLPSGTGPIAGLHRQEERLNALSNVQIIHLRAGYFMENLMWAIPGILQSDVLKTPLRSDIAVPMVATSDIGMKVAELLDQLSFTGHTICDFLGPRSIKMGEVAAILGRAIDKPGLKYVSQSEQEMRSEMTRAGIKPKVIEVMIEMYNACNNGKCLPTQELTPDRHGTTSLEEFAKIFAKAYKSQLEKRKIGI